MATEPVLSGDIPSDGVLEVLREIEARRITGKIRFVIGAESGEVELVGGQIAMDQDPLPDGSDPVEALLQARSGIYAVHAVLPALPVSQGDEHERRGSLAVHVPADLMTYCEQAGLTGVLEMRNEGRVVEVVYESGEMLGIRLDGREEADLGEVFAWDQGAFRITSRTSDDVRSRLPDAGPEADAGLEPAPEAPEDPADREPTVRFARPEPDGGPTRRYAKVDGPAPGREDTGKQFLRVVEMALTDVVTVREKARASVRSAPPPKARPSVRPPGRSAAKQKDSTVRIVWIGGEPSVEREVPAVRPASMKPEVFRPPEDRPPTSERPTRTSEPATDEPAGAQREEASGDARQAPTKGLPEKAPDLPAKTPDTASDGSSATVALLVLFLIAIGVLAFVATRTG
jgi:hypothetical protein